MLNNYTTIKKNMTQAWDKSGKRHAITVLKADSVVVTQVKNLEKDGYQAIQVGLGSQKPFRISKPQASYYKKIDLKVFPRKTKELSPESNAQFEVGQTINHSFEVGDIINAQGTTKGRGFTGVIKRWGFAGGPRTHGQSDRERAPGSIGQGTDPGRVHRGKKMPGHYGNETKTIKNLMVVHIDAQNNEIWISGAVPGNINGYVTLTKVGHKDSFKGLDLKQEPVKDVKVESTELTESKPEPKVDSDKEAAESSKDTK